MKTSMEYRKTELSYSSDIKAKEMTTENIYYGTFLCYS